MGMLVVTGIAVLCILLIVLGRGIPRALARERQWGDERERHGFGARLWDFSYGTLLIGGLPLFAGLLALVMATYALDEAGAMMPTTLFAPRLMFALAGLLTLTAPVATLIWVIQLRLRRRVLSVRLLPVEVFFGIVGSFAWFILWLFLGAMASRP